MISEREAIEKLIRDVESAENIRTKVPRRIFALFAIMLLFGFGLLVLAVKFGRRDQPVQLKSRQPSPDF